MKVAHVLYPGFTALDVVGAFQVFAGAPGVDPVFVALEPGPVVDHSGHCPLHATEAVADVLAAHVVVVPGSEGAGEPDAAVLAWLRLIHPTTLFTVSVGTGALWLAAASLLEGGEAATHWASAEKLRRFGVRYSDERVVRHGKIITAAGSSAGIDMALTVVGLTHGPAVAQAVQLALQYDPEPPFDAGTPAKAPAQIGELVHAYYAHRS
jgi:transcriptional regulator GlxA family with amidase domain